MNTENYQSELNNLRELAVEFAEKHPALAPQLSGPSPDPDAERILEGVAFLTGNIRQKLDDDFPEFAQSLMQMIFPHYLRPLPSSTVIQFTPKSILKTALNMPNGTFVDANPLEGTSCRFKTCHDVNVAPVSVSSINMIEKGIGRRTIEVNLQLSGVSLNQWANDGITFFIGGDYVGAAELFFLLQHKLKSIDISSGNSQEVIQLESSALEALGFNPNYQLIPFPLNGFPAFRRLQEFFLFKEKFLFMRLSGLKKVNASGQVTIRFNLENVDNKLPTLGTERFTLHATPAVNLFPHDADPIKLTHRISEVRIRPNKGRSKGNGDHYDIYSVNAVTGNNRRAASKTHYTAISGFYSGESDQPVYQTSVRAGDEDRKNDTYLSLFYPPKMEISSGETLSIELTCSNGSLPSKLRPGDVSRPTSSTSELVAFSNVSPPSEGIQIPRGGALLWRLLSHLSLNYLSLANAENLRALLSLYVFPGLNSRQQEAINQKKISGIREVNVTAADRLVEGSLLRGQEIEIVLDSEEFAGQGDMILFATLLDSLFHSYASFNCYTATTVKEINSGEVFSWPARLGDKPLI
jgi:type VI secretion system protein ImpG